MTATMTTIRVTLTCQSPLCHGTMDSADIGNAVAIRRLVLVGLPGHPRIPAVSGNSLRGTIRRILWRDLFDRLDLSRDTLPGRQWDRLYAALANGGHLEGSEGTVDPAARRALRAALPPLSALGAALYTYMLEGRVQVGWCWPVCEETLAVGLCLLDDVPEGYPVVCAEELVHEVSQVRHVDRDEHDSALSGVTPMPVTLEALGTGTVLISSIPGPATPLEGSCIAWALERVTTLGGKAGTGYGRIRVEHDGNAEPYSAWLADADSRTRAREALVSLAGRMA